VGRILVTGAAGFIGARTAGLLLDEGREVVGLDDLNDAYDPRVKENRLAALTGRAGFSFVRANVADRAALAAALPAGAFDAVINLAARAGVRTSVENPWIYVDTNVTGTLNLLALCRERAVPKFVLASTSSVYGDSRAELFREDDESSRPLSPYAATKKAAEAMAYTWHALYGLDVSVLRYFTVYGPAGRPDMSVFRFVQKIREGRAITVFGDGSMSRDFTYVDDIARGTIAALRPLGYEIVNLGGDHPYAVSELVAAVEAALGRRAEVVHAPAHPADVPRTAASIEKARRLLGWAPRVSLREGVAQAVAWYDANRSWAKDVRTQ
jgi:nucleoside-diphosphate-sugar epimerase